MDVIEPYNTIARLASEIAKDIKGKGEIRLAEIQHRAEVYGISPARVIMELELQMDCYVDYEKGTVRCQ